jgi:hypothetical protein
MTTGNAMSGQVLVVAYMSDPIPRKEIISRDEVYRVFLTEDC